MWVLRRFGRVLLFVTPWTVAHQAPLSRAFCRQEYWSGLPCPPPGDLPDPGIHPMSPVSPSALQVDSLPLSWARIVTSFHKQGTWQPKKLTDQDKALCGGLAGLGLRASDFNPSDLWLSLQPFVKTHSLKWDKDRGGLVVQGLMWQDSLSIVEFF